MNEFNVSIHEQRSCFVTVEAETWEEAEEIARERYYNGEYENQLNESGEWPGALTFSAEEAPI